MAISIPSVVAVPVFIAITPAITVPIPLAVPAMVMVKPATAPVPVTVVEAAAFVTGAYPTGAFKRGASPVAVVPDVAITSGIPIAFDPREIRTRAYGLPVYAGSRGRPDSDSQIYLTAEHRARSN